jgi:O-antigen ligase
MTTAPANPFPRTNLAPGYVAVGGIPGTGGGFQQLGYGVLIVYLFLIYSRIFDVKFASLHIPGISFRIILVMMLASQSFVVALKTDIGRAMTFMFVWFVCAIPFSEWRRGSYEYLTAEEFPSFVVFLAVVGLIANFPQFRRAMSTIALAFFVLTLIAVFWGTTENGGRLFLPQGKFSNPNEMGQALLLGMPLWWLVLRSATTFPKRAIALGVLALMLLMLSKTGSRGAMIAIAVVLLCAFMRASMMGKLMLVVGVTLLFFGAFIATPGKLLHRYTTMSGSQEEMEYTGDEEYDASMASAVTSSQARQYLLKESLKLTFRHPIFGVGPAMFPVAEDADAKARGLRHGAWQGTHNSYTEVSSEIGIPGAIAYILVIAFSLRNSWRLHKRTSGDVRLKDISDCAACLNYCLIIYAVTVLFDYIAFTSMLSVFGGITAALCRVADAEIERRLALPAPAAPIPFHQFRPNWRATAGLA